MNYDKMQKLKKPLEIRKRSFLAISLIFFALATPLFLMCVIDGSYKGLWGVAFFAAMGASLLPSAISDIRLIKQFDRIPKDRHNNTYDVKLYRPKFKYLTRGSGYKGRTVMFFGIVFFDANKNKYYYFFDDEKPLTKPELEMIKEKLWRELNLQCYENTSIVKTIENDPYFMRIRY